MGNLSFNRTLLGTLGFLGGTVGAAGWILGAGEELAAAGYGTEATLVLLCAAGVLLTGGILWSLWLAGRNLSSFVLVLALLGASFTFGVLALYIMQTKGVVAFAIDSSGGYPEWLAYAAPIALLAIMACLWCTPIRERLQRARLYNVRLQPPKNDPVLPDCYSLRGAPKGRKSRGQAGFLSPFQGSPDS